MPIPITCPRCQANGFVPDQALRQNATCPICQTTFTVTEHAAAPPESGKLVGWVDPMTVAPDLPAAPIPAAPMPAAPMPAIAPQDPATVEAGLADWLKAERQQFDSYVANQLARLARLRRENADAETRHEESCIKRSMELGRLASNLEARRAELDDREAECRARDESARALADSTARRVAELAEREGAVGRLESRTAELRAEAASLSALVAELRPAVEHLELRRTEAQAIQAELKSKQAGLDRRLIEVGRSELSIQKRSAELLELERTLQEEFEAREAELERQRATLLEEVRSLRGRLPVDVATPPPRGKSDPAPSRETPSETEMVEVDAPSMPS